MKNALICGAGGFIGSHLVKRLKKEGFWVRGVDLKYPEFAPTAADDFVIGDLRDPQVCKYVVDQPFMEIYQLAADMGGAGFVFTGDNDADIMHNSAQINLNMLEACIKRNVKRNFGRGGSLGGMVTICFQRGKLASSSPPVSNLPTGGLISC